MAQKNQTNIFFHDFVSTVVQVIHIMWIGFIEYVRCTYIIYSFPIYKTLNIFLQMVYNLEVAGSSDAWDKTYITCCDFGYEEITGFDPESPGIKRKRKMSMQLVEEV